MLRWQPHKSKLHTLAYSPCGRWVATAAGASRFVWVWHATTGTLAHKLTHTADAIQQVAFSPDGTLLAAAPRRHGELTIWETTSTRRVSALGAHPVTATEAQTVPAGQDQLGPSLAFSPDGATLWSGSRDHLFVWHTSPGSLTFDASAVGPPRSPDLRLPHTHGPVECLVFHPGGQQLLVGGAYQLVLIEPHATRELRLFRDPAGRHARVSAVTFSPDGGLLAIAFGHRVVVWNWHDLIHRPITLTGHTDVVKAVAFRPDGRTLLSAGRDGTARFWNLATTCPEQTFDWQIGKISAAAISPDGSTCAVAGYNGQLIIWDVDG